MGFLSKLWGGIKNVFKGVLKIFSPILKPLAKLFDSGLGKVLMIAASVFTFGTALMAGGAGFMSGLAGTAGAGSGGFMQAFVEGGKAFAGSLMGMGGADPATVAANPKLANMDAMNALQSGAEAGSINPLAQNMDMAASNLQTGGALSQAKNIGDAAGGMGGTSGIISAVPPGADTASKLSTMNAANALKTGASMSETALKGAAEGNWLTKAAGKAWEFAKSDLGKDLIGGAMEGYSKGARDEAYFDHQSRYDRMWQNPDDPGNVALRGQQYEAPVPNASFEQARIVNERNRAYKPSIPYRRAPAGG